MGAYLRGCVMWQLLLKYLTVFAWSGLKFMIGVASGIGFGLGGWELFILTFLGGITGTTLFTLFGVPIRRWVRRQFVIWQANRRRRQETNSGKRGVRQAKSKKKPNGLIRFVTRRFGLPGVAFLTPPLLSPPIGTAMALALGAKPRVVVVWMAIAMLFWSAVFALLGQQVLGWFEVHTPAMG